MKEIKGWNQLNEEYGKLSNDFRASIEKAVKAILAVSNGDVLSFNESVLVHLINDNIFAKCVKIRLDNEDKKSLIFDIECHTFGDSEPQTDYLDTMDCASMCEIMLALAEKSYSVTNSKHNS